MTGWTMSASFSWFPGYTNHSLIAGVSTLLPENTQNKKIRLGLTSHHRLQRIKKHLFLFLNLSRDMIVMRVRARMCVRCVCCMSMCGPVCLTVQFTVSANVCMYDVKCMM